MLAPDSDFDARLKKNIEIFGDRIIQISGRRRIENNYIDLIKPIETECQKFLKREWKNIEKEAAALYKV